MTKGTERPLPFSWQPFLGRPEIVAGANGIHTIKSHNDAEQPLEHNAYICVFDLDANHKDSISPVKIEYFVRVSTDTLAHYAFKKVPKAMLTSIQSNDAILALIRARLAKCWPTIADPKPLRVRRKAPP